MCLFKEKDFKDAKKLNWLVGTGIIAIVLAIIIPLTTGNDLATSFATAQLALNAAAFIVILVALCYTIAQARKSMAKPRLEVFFSDSGNSKTSIDIPRDRTAEHHLKLSVINRGNAVTKLFQIDFKVASIFDPRLEPTVGLVLKIAYAGKCSNPQQNTDNTSTISYFSDEQVYCFINAPAPIYMLKLITHPSNYDSYPNEFTITYRVFGDWAETQEGTLKVNCNKL